MAQFDFERLLKETMGLDSTTVGSATIDSAVRLRMDRLRFKNKEDYWEKLRGSDDELQELIEAVVVPETWFFRDVEAFSALARLVSQERIPNSPSTTLRMLSVPCCTGEEPYSMVMSCLDAGLPREKFKVDAVDISIRALIRANRGIYKMNSFRGDDLTFRDRYFEESRNGYSLVDRFRDVITFHHGNLLSPDFRVGSAPYDIVFCRNVLIYFDRNTQERVMKILDRLLCSTGLLFVGPSETFLAASSGFKSIGKSMSFAFRKASARSVEPMEILRTKSKRVFKSVHKARPSPKVQTSSLLAPSLLPSAAKPIDLENIKRLADAGRQHEAGELCQAYLKQHGSSSQAYYLLGLIRDAAGEGQRAAEYYRKALYLEPTHGEALVHLALLCEKQGDIIAAQRLRDRARRIPAGVER